MQNQSVRLLHVDDAEEEFILVREMLSSVQDIRFEFQWAADVQKAAQALNREKFDVCLVDYYAGIDNGLDFIRLLIAEGVTVPFILLSGQADKIVIREALKVGVRQFVDKDDLSTSILLNAIQNAIASAAC